MGLLLIAAALPSCDMKEASVPAEQAQLLRFHAVMEQPVEYGATKAYADTDYKLFWNEGDHISCFHDITYNRECEFDGLDGATAGDFEELSTPSGTAQKINPDHQYAVYPYYKKYNMCDTDGNLTVFIFADQKFYDDRLGIGARPLMVARDQNGILMFKHVGSYVGVRLKGDGVKVASISIKGNNSEILAGRMLLFFDENGLPVSVDENGDLHAPGFDPRFVSSSGSETITMSFGKDPVELNMDDYKVFWFNLPEITFEKGLVITITDVNGGSCVINKTARLEFPRTYFRKTSATVEIASEVNKDPNNAGDPTPSENDTF